MRAQELTEQDAVTYNQFTSSQGGSFLQSWGWGEWQKQNGRAATRLLVQNSHGKPLLGAQVMRHALPFGQCYMYCPYGPVVAGNIAPAETGEAVRALISSIAKTQSSPIFLKLEPAQNLHVEATRGANTTNARIQPASTLILNLQSSETALLGAMHPKTRYNIKISEKHNVEVRTGEDLAGPEATAIINLITETTTRHGYRGHSANYYKDFCAFFSQGKDPQLQVRWYGAYLSDTLLSGGVFIDFGGTRTYLYGGSRNEQRNAMAPYALHWQAIRDAQKQTLTHYDFGGLETSSGTAPGFARFKQGFGGTTILFPKTIDLPFSQTKYQLYRLARIAYRFKK